MTRAPSAYFLFAEAVRAQVQAELQAENPEAKISVAMLGKAIGERWRALSDEQKQHYKTLAAEKAVEAGALAEEGAAAGAEHEGGSSAAEAALPTSLVKRIMLMDDEVARVGAEGLRAVAAAAEAFLGLLASKALSRAGGDKRKNFRFDDLLAVAKQDRRLGVMGLSDVLQRDPAFEEASWLGEGHVMEIGKGLSKVPRMSFTRHSPGHVGYSQLSHPVGSDIADTEAAHLLDTSDDECIHKHHSNRAPWLRALVLGANDGLVSVASLLMGVGAGSTSLTTLRLSGIAGLVGGALSMGVGEYISVSSQRDAELADIEVERREQLKGPDARRREQRELAEIYVARGLPPALADEVATVLSDRHVDDVVRTHARDELGIDVDELAQPFQAALISVLCFTAGGGLPLLSACFIADPRIRLYSIAIATTIGLILFGTLGACLGGAHPVRGAARVVVGGWLALAVVYGIGRLVGEGA
ncbi:hypothetical protein QBZ16_001763 [Prototheca wickerhamii]|uniref:HMG box domain-containing protein n=1 Tax=Prototheca wickerhamii TaxID=3111 RepID=A0AAD9IEP0_PROWI|nr:hypothetical protein QBZ16_001763 [Prototheca wickerhamii]